jgi:hypothetical protein
MLSTMRRYEQQNPSFEVMVDWIRALKGYNDGSCWACSWTWIQARVMSCMTLTVEGCLKRDLSGFHVPVVAIELMYLFS